jgi:hypothetical protein
LIVSEEVARNFFAGDIPMKQENCGSLRIKFLDMPKA